MTDAELQKVFRSKFAPLRPEIAPGVCVAVDPNRGSYFDEVFEPAAIVPLKDIVPSLIGLWQHAGMQALVALEPELRRMAKELRAPDSQDQEISNFIYAMY